MVDVEAVHKGERIPTLTALINQESELRDNKLSTVTCPCGTEGQIHRMYRCYYCDILFCEECAGVHFDG